MSPQKIMVWIMTGAGRAVAHGTTGLLGQSHHFVCVEAAG